MLRGLTSRGNLAGETSRDFPASAKKTAQPLGGSKPRASIGVTTSAETRGARHLRPPGAPGVRGPARGGPRCLLLDPKASLPSLGPQLPPFHTRPGARCRGVESVAAASVPTSALNSFSLRTETFLSRTTLTPTQGSTTPNRPLHRHPQSRRPRGPPTRSHWRARLVEIATAPPLWRKRLSSSSRIGYISRQSKTPLCRYIGPKGFPRILCGAGLCVLARRLAGWREDPRSGRGEGSRGRACAGSFTLETVPVMLRQALGLRVFG